MSTRINGMKGAVLTVDRLHYSERTLTPVMCAVMVYELVENNRIQGSPISTKPYFNYMLGPSSPVLIGIGARFAPCMRLVQDVPPTMNMACPSDTSK